jgi:hypothetical protein
LTKTPFWVSKFEEKFAQISALETCKKFLTLMPSLHWHVFFFLKQIFNLFAKFATDFGNVNVMTGSRPLAKLSTKPLVKALTVLKGIRRPANPRAVHKQSYPYPCCHHVQVLQ